jgi:hypothetical protein
MTLTREHGRTGVLSVIDIAIDRCLTNTRTRDTPNMERNAAACRLYAECVYIANNEGST